MALRSSASVSMTELLASVVKSPWVFHVSSVRFSGMGSPSTNVIAKDQSEVVVSEVVAGASPGLVAGRAGFDGGAAAASAFGGLGSFGAGAAAAPLLDGAGVLGAVDTLDAGCGSAEGAAAETGGSGAGSPVGSAGDVSTVAPRSASWPWRARSMAWDSTRKDSPGAWKPVEFSASTKSNRN